jgi:hypothetical protein
MRLPSAARPVCFAFRFGVVSLVFGATLYGQSWTQRFPVQSPPVRIHYAMAYDAPRGCVILFGGHPGSLRGDLVARSVSAPAGREAESAHPAVRGVCSEGSRLAGAPARRPYGDRREERLGPPSNTRVQEGERV